MQVLIIGGSGFLSGTLARVALEAGQTVWAVTRGQKPLPPGVNAIQVSRQDRAAFASAIQQTEQQWDLVVDCIGFEAGDARQDIEVFRDRARHLVFVSTDFVFDPARRRFPQDEQNAHYVTEGYGAGKRRCELEFIAGDTKGNTGEMAWTVVRPCHIYGPGSQLGCLPLHGRDPQLLATLQARQPLRLVGGGHFLQQPILAADLSQVILSCASNRQAHGQIYVTAGPDIIESRDYYHIVADVLDVELQVEEIPVDTYRAAHPEHSSFLCHRIYDLQKQREHGLAVSSTPIEVGLREHVMHLMQKADEQSP